MNGISPLAHASIMVRTFSAEGVDDAASPRPADASASGDEWEDETGMVVAELAAIIVRADTVHAEESKMIPDHRSFLGS